MSNPVTKLAESIGHDCQTGCGNRADVVLVQLATAETDIMCQPCLLAMMTVVAQTVAESPEAAAALDGDHTAADAIAAANAALAGS